MSWLRPRSIRGQLIWGLILLEGLLVVVFAALLVREQTSEIHERARARLTDAAKLLTIESQKFLNQGQEGQLEPVVRAMTTAPNILHAFVTDTNGVVIASSDPSQNGRDVLTPAEKQRISTPTPLVIFRAEGGFRECVAPIDIDGRRSGYAWIYEDVAGQHQQIYSLIRITFIFAALAALGTAFVASFLAGSITRPLNRLLSATRKLIRDPETKEGFPLEVTSANEAADLTRAFNLIVTSIEEQRGGLNDTLALLDSMLENAPIGFAFFDRKFRYVRINQFLADMNRLPISRHLGRSITEMPHFKEAEMLQSCVQNVFETGQASRDFELNSPASGDGGNMRSWLINVYPVKTAAETVRWVGAIIVETTERKRSEEALRKTEKLAAAGRLAASVAHEINNPLEAVTNLLYLLSHQPSLDEQARSYAELAQREVSRVSELAQQTLRFYRQTTLPTFANLAEVLDSVLTLYQGRFYALQVDVQRDYGSSIDLYCFSGELRQLFANLIGNALDAMGQGGRLWLTVRRSRSWSDNMPGIRIFVADTGCGMSEGTRHRIFEPFFTTKEATGTGLGLWVSDEIIHKHKGSVWVRSQSSETTALQRKPSGTVFMLFFPDDGIGVTQKSLAEATESAPTPS